MILVTSFSPQGYEAYGKSMLESAFQNFKGSIIAYYDEEPEECNKVEGVIYADLTKTYGFRTFLGYIDRSPVFSGKTPAGYNYNYDARKFSKKVFAQLDVLKPNTGKVLWVDSDSLITKPLTEEFVSSLFNGKALSYLGRAGFHTETGFVGFDTDKHDFPKFLEKYTECYRKGRIFTLQRWHDCAAFDWALEQSGASANNLSPNWKMGDDLDVMPSTVLSGYILHMKGNKKWKQTESATA